MLEKHSQCFMHACSLNSTSLPACRLPGHAPHGTHVLRSVCRGGVLHRHALPGKEASCWLALMRLAYQHATVHAHNSSMAAFSTVLKLSQVSP
jgi:hypothetical protein